MARAATTDTTAAAQAAFGRSWAIAAALARAARHETALSKTGGEDPAASTETPRTAAAATTLRTSRAHPRTLRGCPGAAPAVPPAGRAAATSVGAMAAWPRGWSASAGRLRTGLL